MAAAPSSSGPFFGIREENQNQMKQLHSSSTGLPPPKKKRNHPGNPSKRDSFMTHSHRAFCDALAQETACQPTHLNSIGGLFYGS
ncbi:hypothetical protein V6N13_035671 [Hibiscus sabdariffa]